MKKTPSLIVKIASIAGLTLGAFTLSVFATYAWTGPSLAPPNGNVSAPINVGVPAQTQNVQTKYDSLQIGLGLTVMQGISALNLNISDTATISSLKVFGGSQAYNKVLIATDSSGNTSWLATTTLKLNTPAPKGVIAMTSSKTVLGITVSSTTISGVSGFDVLLTPTDAIQKRIFRDCGAGSSIVAVSQTGDAQCSPVRVTSSLTSSLTASAIAPLTLPGTCNYGGRHYSPGVACGAPSGVCSNGGDYKLVCQAGGTWSSPTYYETTGGRCLVDC